MSMLVVSKNSSTGLSAYVDQATGQAYLSATLITQISGMQNRTLDKLISDCCFKFKYCKDIQTNAGIRTNGGNQQGVKLLDYKEFEEILVRWKPSSLRLKIKRLDVISKILETESLKNKCHNLKPFCDVLSVRKEKEKEKENHYLGESKEYKVWCGLRQRCLNKNSKAYKNYGGRGIFVCDEWKQDFKAFYNYLSVSIGMWQGEEFSLDRIDNDRGYEPGNIRWATQAQQCNNTRKASSKLKWIPR